MLKKIIVIFFFFSSFFTHVFAGSAYLGAGAVYFHIRGGGAPSYDGVAPGLYAGFGSWTNEYLYLALEGFGLFQPHNTGNDNGIVSLKPRYNYGISLIPAVNLDNTLLAYLRLGYVRTSFKELDVVKNSVQVGIGLEVPIVNCFSLRGEYDYTPYHISGSRVESNQAALTLIYRFESILPGSFLA